MKISAKKQTPVVGLDIEAGSVAAAEVVVNGDVRVGRTGLAPLAPGVTRDGEIADRETLSATLKELFAQTKLPKTVRVGVANQRVVVRTLRLPQIDDRKELATAIRFQAQDHVPMPLDQSVLDWQVVAQRIGEGNRQMDVVVVAARRDMVSSLVETVRAAGLKPIGIDVAAFGMIRALAPDAGVPEEANAASYEQRVLGDGTAAGDPVEVHVPAKLYCNLGDVTNLAVAQGAGCLFTRVSSFGIEGIVQRLAERRGLTLEHSRMWLSHVGLNKPVERIEGDEGIVRATRDALSEGSSKLADELRLSLDYYGAQEGALAVEEIVACGPGTTIEGMTERLERDLGYPVRVAQPEALSHLDAGTAARLTLPFGLGLEE